MLRRFLAIGVLAGSVAMLVFAGWYLVGGGNDVTDCDVPVPAALEPRVVATHPHDPEAYTQGLLVAGDGALWESTGLRGQSDLRRVDVDTGEVLESRSLEADLFGEGLTEDADGELLQLTWTSGTALRWNRDPLEPAGEFTYDGEGWGITTLDDGFHAMSDGSSTISYRSPSDFSVVGSTEVRRDGGSASDLNELEWDGERLWANRYQSDEILRIDLDCGVVDAVLDASALTAMASGEASVAGLERDFEGRDVLNGIAWLGEEDPEHYYVTGKRWPVLYEVTFEQA